MPVILIILIVLGVTILIGGLCYIGALDAVIDIFCVLLSVFFDG